MMITNQHQPIVPPNLPNSHTPKLPHTLSPFLPFPLPLFLSLFLFLAACSSDFDPIVDNDNEFFSIYGYLDTRSDTQFVRISPVRETAALPLEAGNVVVSSRNEATGDEVVWQDSLVQLDDGTNGFLYYAPMAVTHSERFQLSIRRNDGATTETRVTLPDPTTAATDSVRRFLDEYEQIVIWNDFAETPHNATVQYTVVIPGNDPATITLPIGDDGEAVDDAWALHIPLSRNRNEVLSRLNRPVQGTNIILCSVRMTVDEFGPEWKRPQTDVTNGFGFFGAVVHHSVSWTLTEDVRTEIGYLATDEGCP